MAATTTFQTAPQHLPYDWHAKAVDIGNLPVLGAQCHGQTCLIIDTGAVYVYDGIATWYAIPQLGSGNGAVVTHGKTLKSLSGVLTADADLVPAVSAKRIKVVAYSLMTAGVNASAKIFKSNGSAGTELWRVMLEAPAASSVFGANLATPAPSWLFATVAGEKLSLDVSDTDSITWALTYFDDDAT